MTTRATIPSRHEPDSVCEQSQVHSQRSPRRARRKPVRRFFVVTHRWFSLVMGLALVAVCTSGAILLYDDQIRTTLQPRALHSDHPINRVTNHAQWDAALTAVKEHHPGVAVTAIGLTDGSLMVTDKKETRHAVDAVTGNYIGAEGKPPTWLGFTENLHYCFFSCDELPGHIPLMAENVPGTQGWNGFNDKPLKLGGLFLVILAFGMIFLAFSGLWLYLPRPSRFIASLKVRWRKGRFARDTDLHRVIGVAALVPLLVWGITGANFEVGILRSAWYAVTPGTPLPQLQPAIVKPVPGHEKDPDVTLAAAAQAAEQAVPGSQVTSIRLPGAKGAGYTVKVSKGFDPMGHGPYPGNIRVVIDRKTSAATIVRGRPNEPTSQTIWEGWTFPVHAGHVVNGWWRMVWLAFGLTPLILMVTGVSTWLVRRATRKARKVTANA